MTLYEEVEKMSKATTAPMKWGDRPVSATERLGLRRALKVIQKHGGKKCLEES